MNKALLTIILALGLNGCVSNKHLSYTDPIQPIYSKSVLSPVSAPKGNIILKIVSYNIEHAKKVDRAIEILQNEEPLKDADILCLQEMDQPGIEKIADQLGYGYIYYPSVRHYFTKKDFGNAILSRWPLSKSKKYVLPAGGLTQMQRIMISANVTVGDKDIAAYCLHDDVYLSAYTKRDMAKFVLNIIPDDVDYAIVAGDFNTFSRRAEKTVEKEFQNAGFTAATPNVKWTSKHWYLFNKKAKIDHIYSYNMEVVDSGVVLNRSASDHMPIWTKLTIETPQMVSKKRE